MHVLLGDVGDAVGGGGAEVPGVEGGYDFVVDLGAEGLQDAGGGDVALGVDGDFDNDVALDSGGQG
jgi:hypothetical protein